jgi:hypothetical protein
VYEFCSGFAYAPKMQPVVASRDIESLEHEPVEHRSSKISEMVSKFEVVVNILF